MKESLRKGELIRNKLKHPSITEIRGKGLMLAAILETPELAVKMVHKCMENGLILFFLLFESRALRISPPLSISDHEITIGCEIILKSLKELKELKE